MAITNVNIKGRHYRRRRILAIIETDLAWTNPQTFSTGYLAHMEDIDPTNPVSEPATPRASRSLLTVSAARHDTILASGLIMPDLIDKTGEHGRRRFVEFFTANIRNPNTRKAYALAVGEFLAWCDRLGVPDIDAIEPVLVASYVEQLQNRVKAPTVRQHLAAIRAMFDYLVTGGVIRHNPSASVRGPKHVVRKGLTPVLTADEARMLLESIETGSVRGLRDRAMISVMVYSFARVGAVLGMRVEDYYVEGRRAWFRLHEKGGRLHCVPAHHKAADHVEAYIEAAGVADDRKGPLFRAIAATDTIRRKAPDPSNVLAMIKRRATRVGLPQTICCHTFRATGITAYLSNGGTIENAQAIAAHECLTTTKLYDRTGDTVTLDEIERILI